MRILRLSLENFQGIRKAEFKLDGHNANIYGDNATGKTTIFNAFTWLIFGKSSTDSKDYTPKTKTADGEAHNLEHSVECEVVDDGGEVFTFKRVYKEVYKKIKGNAEKEFSGHTTDYFINGVPKKDKEYTRYWEVVFDSPEIPKLLSMPFYFPEMLHWEKRRSILLEICGNISDGAIIESDNELKKLSSLLGKNSVEEYKKIVKAALTEINKQLQSIPARIDEANKAIQQSAGLSLSEIERKLAELHSKIADAEQERATLVAGDNHTSLTLKKIAELEAELAEARRKYSEKQQTESAKTFEFIRELNNKVVKAESALLEHKRSVERAKSTVEAIENKRTKIFAAHKEKRDEYERIQAQVFDEAATVCVTCGQDLPTDVAAGIREEFNLNKSSRLLILNEQMNNLNETGKKEASKEMLATAQQSQADAENTIASARSEVDYLSKQLKEAEDNQKQTALPPFEQTSEYSSIIEKIDAVRAGLKRTEPDTTSVDIKLTGYRNQEKALNEETAAFKTTEVQRARIEELKKQEQELGKAWTAESHSLYLCDKFSRVKSSLLTDKINECFSTVSFQLFKKNITNDGIDDTCEVLIPAADGSRVPFPLANNAARINAGLEIISALSKYYGVKLPIFVDNAESVTRLVTANNQLIRLIVSEADKQLRLELL